MFILQEQPIDPLQARAHGQDTNSGAFCCFEGMVRPDEINGSKVNALLYIADHGPCIQQGELIMNEALSLFPVTNALCIQRVGKLNAGELAIWVGVWSGHRDGSFKACRYIIEEVKKRLLIWKKEYLADGSSIWAYGKDTPLIS